MNVTQTCFLNIKDFSGRDIFKKGNGKPGVYLWGFSLEEEAFKNPSSIRNFFPYYVGKSQRCMYARTFEHIGSLRGGHYPIFNVKAAHAGGIGVGSVHKLYQGASRTAKHVAGPMLPDSAFPSLMYFPEGAHLSLDFLSNPGVRKQVDWMMEHFCITFFELHAYSKKDLVDLEKYIGNLVGYDRLITKSYNKPNISVQVDGHSGSSIQIATYEDLFKRCMGRMMSVKYGL